MFFRYLANPSKPYNGTQLDTMCNLEYQSCRDQSKDLNYFCGLMQSNAVFNTRSNLNEGFLDFRIEALEKAQTAFLYRRGSGSAHLQRVPHAVSPAPPPPPPLCSIGIAQIGCALALKTHLQSIIVAGVKNKYLV